MAPTNQRPVTLLPRNQTANGASTHNPGSHGASTQDGTVNRKKQKRRQKQAAKQASEQALQPPPSVTTPRGPPNGHGPAPRARYEQSQNGISDPDDRFEPQEAGKLFFSEEDNHQLANNTTKDTNGKSKRKQNTKSRIDAIHEYHTANATNLPPPPPPPPPMSTARTTHQISKDRIWNTSTAEERERIKEFWLSLEEKDRRSLVKVEKEAVLKKMKEQQKHSCNCTVCGRKRSAIEEELEVLYDAYYEELEQYANHQQLDDAPHLVARQPRNNYPTSSIPSGRMGQLMNSQRPERGRIREVAEDDDVVDDEGYSDEDEDEEDYSDEEDEPRGPAADFFNFGNSLTVRGGILTVADDLLKNDGKKFIEMMEQLAERRMQREEEAHYAAAGLRHSSMPIHNHPPPIDDDEFEDEEDDEFDSQDDDEYDEDEMEAMTEDQRMEEGRRMFQIFAARMFEQRVLTAYREKVARERQEKLLEELADESRLDAQREAKKAKEAQKKKDKKRQQKQVKEEEKARREAEKAAEEATAKALEERKLEEQREKKEEQRKKREVEKRAQEEERIRRETEKQKKLQEAREQQLEMERKQREQKDKEKRKREEAKKKEREERETREKEAKEKKEREMLERREKEAKGKSDKVGKDRGKVDEPASRPPLPPIPIPVPLSRTKALTAVATPAGLPPILSAHASPHLHVATPVIPKAPTPVRPRQASFQDSHHSSPKSAAVLSVSTDSPSSLASQQLNLSAASSVPKIAGTVLSAQPSQQVTATAPIAPPPGLFQPQYGSVPASPSMHGNNFPMHYGSMHGMMAPQRSGTEHSAFAHPAPFPVPQYRSFAAPNGLPFPPGINGIRQNPHGRSLGMEAVPNHPPAPINVAPGSQYGAGHSTMPSHSHSRQASASYDKTSFEAVNLPQTHPIARPTPIQRPLSTPRHDDGHRHSTNPDIDDLSNHLGSSALLDDTDDPLNSNVDDRRGSTTGGPRSGRLGFGGSPMFPDPIGSAKTESFPRGGQGAAASWGTPIVPFGPPSLSNQSAWSSPQGIGWSNSNAFGIIGGANRYHSRSVTIRLLACQACKQLSANAAAKNGSEFHSLEAIMHQVEQYKPHEAPLQPRELVDIFDTEGNSQNGGGTFTVDDQLSHGIFVKFEPDTSHLYMGGRGTGAAGEIGSPIVGNSMPAINGAPRGFPPSGGGIASTLGF